MLLVLHYRGLKWTFLNSEGVLVWVKFARWWREIKALFLPPSFWLVYLACQSLASPPAACCIPRDLEPSRIYSCASSLCLWGLSCHYSLCLGGSGWQQKGWRGAEGWGWQNESWRWQVLGLGVDFISPLGLFLFASAMKYFVGTTTATGGKGPSCILAETCGTEHHSPRINGCLISYGRHSSSSHGGGGTALSRCAWDA